jgi:hypothetical protein
MYLNVEARRGQGQLSRLLDLLRLPLVADKSALDISAIEPPLSGSLSRASRSLPQPSAQNREMWRQTQCFRHFPACI